MQTLDFIVKKFNLNPQKRGHTEIPNFGRDQLAGLFSELGFKVGVEVGTERGFYAETLCKANPVMKLYCVDPWIAHSDYKEHVFTNVMDRNYEITKERMTPYNCELIRKMSRDALGDFEDESLDFVYLDGNHAFESVVHDVYEWSKKVRKDGIISGHDYVRPKTFQGAQNDYQHVVDALDAYTEAYKIRPWFVLGRNAKIPGETRDNARSWLFIKK